MWTHPVLDPCNFRRKNPDAAHLLTTFVLQTRLEILQRKLFRERQKELEELYPNDYGKILDNFYLHIMGKRKDREFLQYFICSVNAITLQLQFYRRQN